MINQNKVHQEVTSSDGYLDQLKYKKWIKDLILIRFFFICFLLLTYDKHIVTKHKYIHKVDVSGWPETIWIYPYKLILYTFVYVLMAMK